MTLEQRPTSENSRSDLPGLFPRRGLAGSEKLVGKLLGLPKLADLYGRVKAVDPEQPLPERLLRQLEVSYQISERDLERVPTGEPVLALANHPFGFLEAAILASLLPSVRDDLKFMANSALLAVPELYGLLDEKEGGGVLPITEDGIRRALHYLERSGMLVMFPSIDASHFQWRHRGIVDSEWHPAVVSVVRDSGVPILPVFVDGANSLVFQAAGMIHRGLQRTLLPRELLNKRRRTIEVRIGAPIPAEKLRALDDGELIHYLRWRTYLLGARSRFKAETKARVGVSRRRSISQPVATPRPKAVLELEIEKLGAESLLLENRRFSCFLAESRQIPNLLREIGRLREVSFRKVGEGTGREVDLDSFDDYYLHLFLWEKEAREIAGAYRLARTDVIRKRLGKEGLYTATLFHYPETLLDEMGPALELGRSFIQPEYQNTFEPLLLIWKAIARYVIAHPRYKILFGPVSISNEYQPLSRKLIVTFLAKNAWLTDWARFVIARNPFKGNEDKYGVRAIGDHSGLDLEDLSSLITDLEESQPGIPVLLRHYLRLGGKLLGFNVDKNFSDTLDGLILVDLTRTDPRILGRYMGKAEARDFLAHHSA